MEPLARCLLNKSFFLYTQRLLANNLYRFPRLRSQDEEEIIRRNNQDHIRKDQQIKLLKEKLAQSELENKRFKATGQAIFSMIRTNPTKYIQDFSQIFEEQLSSRMTSEIVDQNFLPRQVIRTNVIPQEGWIFLKKLAKTSFIGIVVFFVFGVIIFQDVEKLKQFILKCSSKLIQMMKQCLSKLLEGIKDWIGKLFTVLKNVSEWIKDIKLKRE